MLAVGTWSHEEAKLVHSKLEVKKEKKCMCACHRENAPTCHPHVMYICACHRENAPTCHPHVMYICACHRENAPTCTCMCMYVYMHICACIYIHIYIYVCIYVYECTTQVLAMEFGF